MITPSVRVLAPLAALCLPFLPLSRADEAPKEVVLREALVVRVAGRGGRTPVHTDPVEALIVAGKWAAPKAGDKVTLPGGTERAWETVKAGADGALSHPALPGGYAFWQVSSGADRVMVLEASGHSLVYVNGEPRAGDPYGNGTVRLPVLLRKGDNGLLFLHGRGALRARLVPPKAPAYLDLADMTLPDLVAGVGTVNDPAAVLVVNATAETADGLTLEAALDGGKAVSAPVPPLPPLATRKVRFTVEGPVPTEPGQHWLALRLVRGGAGADSARLRLDVRRPDENRKITFTSGIDGSVQYYALNPARPVGKGGPAPALFLTLHGAGVEAPGQTASYAAKSWGHLVAPTNRRPYGFDWEDWGRLDALEVLADARKRLGTDPRRTYLTGHSMGGHGAWHLGVTFPDRFAAVGPSAGWVSMWSYAGAVRPETTTAVPELLLRAMNPSDTLALSKNYAQHGVYILHGAADDNVPVGQARQMKADLEKFHRDFVYHEQPGAGHWWGAPDQSGTACVDWVPMFDFFARHVIPAAGAVSQVDFVTANPGVSARSHWATIEAQVKALKPSSVSLRRDPGLRRFTGTTDNVARLALDVSHLAPGAELAVHLDGQKMEKLAWPEKGTLWLTRAGDEWSATGEPSPSLKGPRRGGSFKDAFRNRMVFVYATKGTTEENAWALARARYDAETFWYRGNGSVDVVPDRAFDPSAERDRNVILYGNGQTNAAWAALLGESPVQVKRGSVTVGGHEEKGDDLACLFVRPRPGSDTASVAAVAGTGVAGMRLGDRLPYFVSGVAYPDCLVLGAETLGKGFEGVRGAGFFGNDWGVASGEFAWRKEKTQKN